jgi:type IV pilus assembly protein PilP
MIRFSSEIKEVIARNLPYAAVAILTVSSAFLISIQFLRHVRAQDAQSPPAVPGAAPGQPAGAPAALPAPGSPDANTSEPQADQKPETKDSVSDLEGFLEPFIYDTVNRRDPFQPYSEYEPTNDQGNARPLSAAQKYELDQLKLVGIMWDVKDPRAMFLDPDKDVLILGRDEGIGNHNGYIAAIREGEVVVVEASRHRGDLIYKTKVLRIER